MVAPEMETKANFRRGSLNELAWSHFAAPRLLDHFQRGFAHSSCNMATFVAAAAGGRVTVRTHADVRCRDLKTCARLTVDSP
jgi:hypothetical protein